MENILRENVSNENTEKIEIISQYLLSKKKIVENIHE